MFVGFYTHIKMADRWLDDYIEIELQKADKEIELQKADNGYYKFTRQKYINSKTL